MEKNKGLILLYRYNKYKLEIGQINDEGEMNRIVMKDSADWKYSWMMGDVEVGLLIKLLIFYC